MKILEGSRNRDKTHKTLFLFAEWKDRKNHREDGNILYNRRILSSEKELIEQVKKHKKSYNNTAKTVLKSKRPNQVVSEYFSKCNICLDN